MPLDRVSYFSVNLMETVLDTEGIKKLLPHRYPFLLVDRVIEFVPREPSEAFLEMLHVGELELGNWRFSQSFLNEPRVAGVVLHEQYPHRLSPFGAHTSLPMSPPKATGRLSTRSTGSISSR